MDQVSGGTGYRQSVLASASYPRIYRYSPAMRGFLYVFAAAMAAGGGWLMWLSLRDPSTTVLLLSAGAGLMLMGLWIAASCTVSCMTLRADSIEIRGVFRSRLLRRDAILGRRLQPTRGKPIQLLVTKAGGRPLRLDSGYRPDSVLEAWIATFPDLDRQECEASEAKLAADSTYGSSPKERLDRLAKARGLARVAHGLTVVVSVWAYIYPRPYALVIVVLALLPWCAVALVGASRGLIRFDTVRNDARPNIAVMLIMPGVVLGVRALFDVNLLDLKQALEVGFLAGLPLFAAIMLVNNLDNSTRGWGWPVAALLMVTLPYGGGLLSVSDTLLDHATPRVFPTEVVSKYISSGKHRQPYLVLAPWGPESEGDKVAVSGDYYAQVPMHETVCVALHPGRFALRWYRVNDCEPTIDTVRAGTP
jgi:hypothetical protein